MGVGWLRGIAGEIVVLAARLANITQGGRRVTQIFAVVFAFGGRSDAALEWGHRYA